VMEDLCRYRLRLNVCGALYGISGRWYTQLSLILYSGKVKHTLNAAE
jgi:hypothetical protein